VPKVPVKKWVARQKWVCLQFSRKKRIFGVEKVFNLMNKIMNVAANYELEHTNSAGVILWIIRKSLLPPSFRSENIRTFFSLISSILISSPHYRNHKSFGHLHLTRVERNYQLEDTFYCKSCNFFRFQFIFASM